MGVGSNSLPLWGDHLEGYRHPHLPRVEALDKLWQEVSSKPLYAPRTFSKYLKLRWKMSLRQVDAKQVEVIAPLGKVNDCSSCTDICCVGPHSTVSLRLQDIAALIDLGRDDLITMEKPDFPEHTRAKRSALRKTLASTGWRTFPVLKKDSMGACAALGRDGQCGLFPHWPLSCARFPYSLHSNCRVSRTMVWALCWTPLSRLCAEMVALDSVSPWPTTPSHSISAVKCGSQINPASGAPGLYAQWFSEATVSRHYRPTYMKS